MVMKFDASASLADVGLLGVLLGDVADVQMVETAGKGDDDPFDDALFAITPIGAPIAAKTMILPIVPQTRLRFFSMGYVALYLDPTPIPIQRGHRMALAMTALTGGGLSTLPDPRIRLSNMARHHYREPLLAL